MPGEPLMCVWQAVLAKDVFCESGVKRATVMSVVENFDHIDNVRYSERRYKEIFTQSKVKFADFLVYAHDNLRAPGVPMPLIINDIEKKCWGMAEDSYTSEALNREDLYKMWTIFNRLCVLDSYPPVMSKQQTNYLFERVAQNIKKTWGSSDTIPDGGLTFQQVINDLDRTYFSVTSTMLVRQCIEDIHSWLVREVMKVGLLHKRTRKSANWTNWQKRWFVMSPGRLEYYHHDKKLEKKGEVIIDTRSEVTSLSDYKSVLSKMENRFKVSNLPSLEIELCAANKDEKDDWIKTLKNNVNAMKEGVTPQMRLLKQRDQLSKEKRSDSLLQTEKELDEAEAIARSVTGRDDPEPKEPADVAQRKPTIEVAEDEDGVYDNNMFEVQKDKIKVVFSQIDKDGNGRIDKEEFADFIKSLGPTLKKEEIQIVFNTIDKDKNSYICLGEFVDYFVNFVMEKSIDSATEAKLRAAFMRADRDGSGAINFREFSEYAYSKRRSMAIDKLMTAFDGLDKEGKGEIQFDDFKKYFESEPAFMELEQSIRRSQNVEDFLRGTYEDSDASKLASYLRGRWDKFASFKRVGAKGELVMRGGHGMVDDIVPGSYTLLDLACFNDLPPVKPKHIAVRAIWKPSALPGKSGRIEFPTDFDGLLPTEIATDQQLAYYGCSLADQSSKEVSLLYRHGIQDFTYENNYLEDFVTAEKALGGAGLEHHEFSHLDCPLEEDSGFFVMGKYEDDDILHLTGFKVPTRQTLYVPAGVIHCNDYLKGTWRTMLSDEVEVNHVQLVKVKREGDMEQVQHFQFSFQPLR